MKNILKYGMLGLGVIVATSCKDTLDLKPKVIFDGETVWGSKASVEGFVYAAYNDIIWNGYAGSGSCVSWEARTPNGLLCSHLGDIGTYDGITHETINSGNDYGSNRFSHLRRANMIIENVENSTTLTEDAKKQLKAHGHMLRGMIFFHQARQMGYFVPVREVFDSTDSLTCEIPLTQSLDESYEYVISDLKYAADNMEENQPSGVPTKWAAKVILSRACLQAYAYTGNEDYLDMAITAAKEVTDNKSLSSSTGMFNETDMYCPEILWAYYREEQNTKFESFYETMRTFPNAKPDDVKKNPYATVQKNPNGITFEAWCVLQPTQELVDQYLVTDAKTGEAKPWNETSQWLDNTENLDPSVFKLNAAGDDLEYVVDSYEWKPLADSLKKGPLRRMPCPTDLKNTNSAHPTFKHYATLTEEYLNSDKPKNISQLMYENRDKRFYTAVVYDGCKWFNEDVELFHGGNLYRGFRDQEDGGWYTTTTNYYWRKSSIESFERAYHNLNMAIHFNLARVGEAYMNLAEAYLLKAKKDASYISKAVAALNATRTTHGGIAPSTATTEKDAWADYIRERNCEMVNEGGDLYFSYLRWGKYGGYANPDENGNPTAPGDVITALNRPVHMIQIDHNRKTILVNQVTLSRAADRVFTTKRYLLPIGNSFLNTREAYGIADNYTQVW